MLCRIVNFRIQKKNNEENNKLTYIYAIYAKLYLTKNSRNRIKINILDNKTFIKTRLKLDRW